MASTAYKFQINTTAASDVNYCSISTNPDLVPVATPRERGFTLRNRWDCAKQTAATNAMMGTFTNASASIATTRYRIIEVPARTYVHNVNLRIASVSNAPTATPTISTISDSDLYSKQQLQFGAAQWKEAAKTNLLHMHNVAPDGHASDSGATFGMFPLTKKTGVIADMPAVSASTPYTNAKQPFLHTTSGADERIPNGAYFPFGGYVTLALGPDNVAMGNTTDNASNDLSFLMAGVWDVVANCTYLPE